MCSKNETTNRGNCLSDARVYVQIAKTAEESARRLAAIQPYLLAEEQARQTYACSEAEDCSYQCAVVVLTDGPLRFVAASGVCELALRAMMDGPSAG